MAERRGIQLRDGRTVAIHEAGSEVHGAPVLVLHYGTPHTGAHPEPIGALAEECGVRVLSVTRPGFPDSPRHPGRTVADTARDVAGVLDRLDVERFATAGYSGGGPHALALAALCGERVAGVATFASPAPYDGTPAWFAGMAAGGAGLRAAAQGRDAREEYQRTAGFDPDSFTETDWAALAGPWAGIGEDARAASALGSDAGEIDDDLAFVAPWDVELGRIAADVVLFQGAADRIIPAHHADRLARVVPTAKVHLSDDAGHVAVLDGFPGWLRALAQA